MSVHQVTITTPDSCAMVLDQLHPEPNSTSLDSVDRISRYLDGIANGAFYFTSIVENICAQQATGTITLSSFKAGDTITIANQVLTGGGGTIMGAAAGYAVIASSTITNTATDTALTGNLALYPGTSVTNFPPGTVSGTQNINNAAAQTAINAAMNAYNTLAALAPTANLTGQDLGGKNLTAGVYKFNSSAGLTGTLTLTGSSTDVFVFQIGSTLTTASASSVVLAGGALPGNVYWQVGSSATLGTTSAIQGNILALASVTMNTESTLLGTAVGLTGAVTFDDNMVTTEAGTPAGPGNSIVIGGTDAITAQNLLTTILANPVLSALITASAIGAVVTVTSILGGPLGNLITLAISADGSVSGATLTGGANGTVVTLK